MLDPSKQGTQVLLHVLQPQSSSTPSGFLPELTALVKEFTTWNHSDIMAACSVFVAACAFFLSIWQALAMVRHNKLSVRPHIDVNVSRAIGKPVSLSVTNDGLGPAFVKDLAITYEGVSYDMNKQAMPPELFKKLTDVAHIHCIMPGPGTAIRPGQEVELFIFYRSIESDAFHNRAVNVCNKIGLKLVYKSIYGTKFIEKMQSFVEENPPL
ncbi:hypothetical protein [Dyella sp.]|jgi:hypothetical protein|uniref:hypothetical protein n=1 Tax=Dyella sp. TaxID=1869338 RepID=UPI002CA2DFAB|nr:hypothetical protein [Dyella sp.]HTC28515.1 hypothetical protein [Dyella sp.]